MIKEEQYEGVSDDENSENNYSVAKNHLDHKRNTLEDNASQDSLQTQGQIINQFERPSNRLGGNRALHKVNGD